jgi:hypothetical protein
MRRLLAGAAVLLVLALIGCARPGGKGSVADPAPARTQQIAFSHAQHAGKAGLQCLFCHGNAARGAEANIPSARDCFVCHWAVGEGNADVAKVVAAVDSGWAIRWPAVVRLPEHVQFDHAAHVRRGVDCAACHGDVAHMDDLVAPRPLGMDFCVACHRREDATRDCVACHR